MATIRGRYREWLLLPQNSSSPMTALERDRYRFLVKRVAGARKELSRLDPSLDGRIYDTRKTGADSKEVHALVAEVLPALATAYQLPNADGEKNQYYHDPALLTDIILAFDRLHDRGFRSPMQMPWKAAQTDTSKLDQAVIVDFQLRMSGYGLATFLMRDELQQADKLQRTLATCNDMYSHTDKMGNLRGPKLGADGIRIALNFGLPYFLAADSEADLDMLQRQLVTSMAITYDSSDTIKPDGLGYHHRGAYMTGYASYAIAQASQIAWLLRGTRWAAPAATIDNLQKALLTLRTVSNKYDMHHTLGGRLGSTDGISQNMLGYAYMADLFGDRNPDMLKVFASLADAAFMTGPNARQVFASARNENTPGPGAIRTFLDMLDNARKAGIEPTPSGNWAYNFGPMSVHRRDQWMVAVKGYSKYLWAFERSILDDRKDARMQNVFGFHDSACYIQIYGQGAPVNAVDSGYQSKGWDWCRIPGGTTRLIPPDQLANLDIMKERFNRPYAMSPFCGGVSIHGQNGLFAQAYNEVAFDQKNSSPDFGSPKEPVSKPERPILQAEKSVFFFDDQVVVLTSGVRNGDGVHPVATTLFQTALPSPETLTVLNDQQLTGTATYVQLPPGPATLTDAAGNGYFVPDAGELIVRRSIQTAPTSDGASVASGAFTSAWFDHGLNPDQAAAAYVILPAASRERLAQFATGAATTFSILQQDGNAHIVRHNLLNQTGFAIFAADVAIGHGLLAAVDRPVLLMTDSSIADKLSVSVCDPDLRWVPGKQYRHNKDETNSAASTPPIPIAIRLTLRGNWAAPPEQTTVTATTDNGTTTVMVKTMAGNPSEFTLTQVVPSSPN